MEIPNRSYLINKYYPNLKVPDILLEDATIIRNPYNAIQPLQSEFIAHTKSRAPDLANELDMTGILKNICGEKLLMMQVLVEL